MQHLLHLSPLGPLRLSWDDEGLRRVWMDPPALDEPPGAWPALTEQLDAYFAGTLRRFDLPLAPRGTPFQQRVWAALRDIPYGETWSYGQLARHLGDPLLTRAVGLANGANPIAIVIPCHRVIGADGRLVGFGGGLARKEQLLRLEGSLPTRRQVGLFG